MGITLEQVEQSIKTTKFDINEAMTLAKSIRQKRIKDLIRQLPNEDLDELINWISKLNEQNPQN